MSSIFAALPLITLFVLLGGVKLKAQWAALDLARRGPAVAFIVYDMPVDQGLLSASEGAVFGLFPIMWIVVTAIWVYNMTVETGHFDVLRRSFGAISDDQRVQAVIIAFCFGALLEALAGFGTPVAITAVMLIAARLPAHQGRRGRARRQHRARRVRRHRRADHHAVRGHRPAGGRPRRDGRPPDAAARADRAADPRRHGRRHARHAPDLARRPRRRRRVRRGAVRLLELHLRRADRHRGLAARHRRDRGLPARVAARRAAVRRALAARGRPAVAGAESHDPALERDVARQATTPRRTRRARCSRPTRRT